MFALAAGVNRILAIGSARSRTEPVREPMSTSVGAHESEQGLEMLRAPISWWAGLRAWFMQKVAGSSRADRLPSWVASLVLHTLAIILLGVWWRAEMAPHGGVHLDVSLQDSGQGDLLDSTRSGAIEAELELESWSATLTPQTAESTPQLTDDFWAEIELSHLATLAPWAGALGGGTSQGLGADEGSAGAAGGGNGKVRTSLFGVGGEGRKFVYVCDCSGSMNFVMAHAESLSEYVRVPFMAARAELLSSLDSLNGEQQFGLIFYNHQVFPFDPAEVEMDVSSGRRLRALPWGKRVFAATEENKRVAREFITRFRADGQTDHLTALDLALRMRPDVIFVLTDAEAKDEPLPQHVTRLTQLNRRRATINIIQFSPTARPDSTMVQLAERNGGKHVFFDITQVQRPVAP